MIVGEFFGEDEARSGRAFEGPAGSILFGVLRQAGIPKENCYFTNVFNFRPRGGNSEGLTGGRPTALPAYPPLTKGKYVQKEYEPELQRLFHEIETVRPNVIVALGNLARLVDG